MNHEATTRRLYKYSAYTAQSLSLLVQRSIWLAEPRSLNDPFDVFIRYKGEPTVENVRAFFRERDGEDITDEQASERVVELAEFHEGVANGLHRVGVFSLSEDPNSIIMWSHYADSHRGFCLEFEQTAENDLRNAQPVRYTEHPGNFDLFDPFRTESSFKDTIYHILYTKPIEWSYEREWRWVQFFRNDGGEPMRRTPFPAPLRSIRFGTRMPVDHMLTILNIFKGDRDDIDFYRMKPIPEQFKLTAHPIELKRSAAASGSAD